VALLRSVPEARLAIIREAWESDLLHGSNFRHRQAGPSKFMREGPIRARPRDGTPTSQDGDARSDLTYAPYSDTARTVRPLVRLWGVSKSIRCPGDRPIKAAPTGVRTEIRLSSMLASCG
jgi:hypothetical protein